MSSFVYAKLPAKYIVGIRLRGSGLANCLFVYGRALVLEQEMSLEMITPTWANFSLGPFLRLERDKRTYIGLFSPDGVSGLKKHVLLLFSKKYIDKGSFELSLAKRKILVTEGLQKYFKDLIPHYNMIRERLIDKANVDLETRLSDDKFIGVHVRLGDYNEERRTPLSWYGNIIKRLSNDLSDDFKFVIFSDGSDQELTDLLRLPNVERAAGLNALEDLFLLSYSRLIIGSDSTFSGWAAFLNQTPIIMMKNHFGDILENSENQVVMGENDEFPASITNLLFRLRSLD
jgi:hypothetical protein